MARDASLLGLGVTSRTMGQRTDLLLVDDLNDDTSSTSTRRRQQAGRGFYEKFLSRLSGSSRVAMVATRWHDEDVPGILLSDATQRKHYTFAIIRCITRGPLKAGALVIEAILPGEHKELRFAQRYGFGWMPRKEQFLADLRAQLPADDAEDDEHAA
jgi:hypothetical protein